MNSILLIVILCFCFSLLALAQNVPQFSMSPDQMVAKGLCGPISPRCSFLTCVPIKDNLISINATINVSGGSGSIYWIGTATDCNLDGIDLDIPACDGIGCNIQIYSENYYRSPAGYYLFLAIHNNDYISPTSYLFNLVSFSVTCGTGNCLEDKPTYNLCQGWISFLFKNKQSRNEMKFYGICSQKTLNLLICPSFFAKLKYFIFLLIFTSLQNWIAKP